MRPDRRLWLCLLCVPTAITADEPTRETAPYRAHDRERPHPPAVQTGQAMDPAAPPSDAIVLFDGDDLNEWSADDGSPTSWIVKDGAMLPQSNSGFIQTKRVFGDVQLHLEWAAPTPPSGKGQGRGNSGVYLMGKYEVQILDSFENITYADGQAAAIYGQNPPLVNACRPPGEWQTYDIIFRRPHFGDDGSLIRPSMVTVLQNGVVVQDHFPFWGPTNWLKYDEYTPHEDALPIKLQDHGNPVRFRNIWIRELTPIPTHRRMAEFQSDFNLLPEQRQPLIGRYQDCQVIEDRDQLQLRLMGRDFDLVPVSPTQFQFKRTDANVTFQLDEENRCSGLVIELMGDRWDVSKKLTTAETDETSSP